MPAIDVQVMEGVFSAEEKADLIRELTRAFGGVAGQCLADNLSVRIHDVESGSWGYAGKALTTQDAKAMRERG